MSYLYLFLVLFLKMYILCLSYAENRLREEHFLTLTPWWMIQKRYLPTSPTCSKCNGRVFRLNSCLQFLDNLCWTCTKWVKLLIFRTCNCYVCISIEYKKSYICININFKFINQNLMNVLYNNDINNLAQF